MLIQLFLIINYYPWWASFELVKFILNKKCSNITNIWCSWAESHFHRISLCSSPTKPLRLFPWFMRLYGSHRRDTSISCSMPIGDDCSEVRIDKDSESLWIKERIMPLGVAICQRFSIRTCGWGATFCHLTCNKNNFGLGSQTDEFQFQLCP